MLLQRSVVFLAIFLIQGCETTPIAGTDVACLWDAPIRYSSRDTPQTIQQVREHNAALAAVCTP